MDVQTTVAEAEGHSRTQVLQAALKAFDDEYQQLSATYAELWTRRKTATLARDDYITYLMCEDRMAVLLEQMEQLKPRVLCAEAADALDAGKAHYDAHTQAVTDAATLICTAWVSFMQACTQFAQVADAQIALLWALPAHDGQPAFDLPSGADLLQRILGVGFPQHGATLLHAVLGTLRVPFTNADRDTVLGLVPGTREFPDTLVRRFLQGYEVQEPHHQEDV